MNTLHGEARRETLARFAKLSEQGRPVVCQPRRGRNPSGHTGKVIFSSRAKALDCADELVALGSAPMRAYQCPESPLRRGHWHLTSDLVRSGWRPP